MDSQRAERVAKLFVRTGYRAVVCRAPQHVLMFTGYLPVLGNSFCIVSLGPDETPEARLAVPADEESLVPADAAVEVRTFSEETLQYIGDTLTSVRDPLAQLLESAGLTRGGRVGYEGGYSPIAAAYTQVGVEGPATLDLLLRLPPRVSVSDASSVLAEVMAFKSDEEVERIRRSASVAHQGFVAARSAIRAGVTEADVEAETVAAVTRAGYERAGIGRVLAHAHCMAGPRAALAHRAYNQTSGAVIKRGDTVLVQMEVALDGYWAELTRTFFAEDASADWAHANQVCIRAQDAAMSWIRDGVRGRDVDEAARQILKAAGLGERFKHGLGHGVGFQAINHSAVPVLHPASDDILCTGMVHNLEPAVYREGIGGLRMNDNVAVRREGAERLSIETPRDLDWLVTGS